MKSEERKENREKRKGQANLSFYLYKFIFFKDMRLEKYTLEVRKCGHLCTHLARAHEAHKKTTRSKSFGLKALALLGGYNDFSVGAFADGTGGYTLDILACGMDNSALVRAHGL